MKYPILTIIAVFLFVACGQEKKEIASTAPNDLAANKALLKEKKATLRELKAEITKLEVAIEAIEPSNKNRRLVTTTMIKKRTFEHFVDIQATVQSDNIFKASGEAGGRLVLFTLEEGDYVTKGKLIGRVDMDQVNKQIAELDKSLELAKIAYQRQSNLWKQNIGSEMQYLKAKNDKERLEKSIESLRFQLTKADIYAPASGIVQLTYVKQGDVVSPGQPLVEILNLSKVKVVADVPESYLQSVKRGQMVTIKFPALEQERKGRISLIGQSIDPNNRTFKVEIAMNNPNKTLKPNLLATVLLRDFQQTNAIILPTELVQQEVSGKDYVMIKASGENGDLAKRIFVELGESYDGESLILTGLDGSEEIIMKGARDLKDGELIEVDASSDTEVADS